MTALRCTILRGGSSKGIYIERDQSPPQGAERDRQILDLFGSPDMRQIDGLGGADKLTSKVAVMGASTRADCDIDYLFGQVGTVIPRIDWTSNCGNLSAGAALYAVHKAYVSSSMRARMRPSTTSLSSGSASIPRRASTNSRRMPRWSRGSKPSARRFHARSGSSPKMSRTK